MSDDLGVRAENLIPERVVVVVVRIDDVANRLGGDRLQVGGQRPPRRRGDFRVDHQRLVVLDDDRRVRADGIVPDAVA